MLTTLSSVRGSPGVTSWTLLLAAAIPMATERVVLEADCSGGVLGARYQLGVDPGATSLISACRVDDHEPEPADHGRLVAEGVWVIPGPEVAEQAVPAWRSGVGDVGRSLAVDRRLWLADLGRAAPDSPSRSLAAEAALNIIVCGDAVEDLVQVPARVASLSELGPTAVLLVGRPVYPEGELHQYFGGRALWVVPTSDKLASIAMRAVQGGRARRAGLWRVALEVGADVAAIARQETTEPPAPEVALESLAVPAASAHRLEVDDE